MNAQERPAPHGALPAGLTVAERTLIPGVEPALSSSEKFGTGLFWFVLVFLFAMVLIDAVRGLLL